MFQHYGVITIGLLGLAAGACSTSMSDAEVESRVAARDARCQELKREIDASVGKPLRRGYLIRQYDEECRR